MIFGSVALKYWYSDFKRSPADFDVISKENWRTTDVECHWIDAFQYILDHNSNLHYVDPHFLYTIKVSHAAWDVNWDKTMKDIIFLQSKGNKLDYTLYQLLYKEFELIHGKKNFKVKGNVETFFNINADHEKLHQLVKFYDHPLHESIRTDKNNVKPSRELWDKLSFDDQIKCALEETFVFALERYIDQPPHHAFSKALKQLITSSTKGWFNLFLIENFSNLVYNRELKDNYLKIYNLLKEKTHGKERCN